MCVCERERERESECVIRVKEHFSVVFEFLIVKHHLLDVGQGCPDEEEVDNEKWRREGRKEREGDN